MNLAQRYLLPLRAACVAGAAASLLAACGGGGDAGSPPPSVTATTASDVRYSQTLTVTINGTHLDQALNVTSAGCRNMARSTTAPFVSSATTAYYRCQASAVGAQQVRAPDSTLLATVPFTVAVPQVTMALSNGAGVNGNIVITLNPTAAPITVDNFLAYVNAGFYSNTIFHRHAANFVLQGGGYEAPVNITGQLPVLKPTNAPIQLEDLNGLSNLRWTVAMARSTQLHSATSQFFINLADNLNLNGTQARPGYAVFGNVTAGTDVVTAAQAAPCSSWPNFFGIDSTDCLPTPNIVITAATQTR
jgi:peptidyl-prolyl cis-trans isomerase A (cyclophilin A)